VGTVNNIIIAGPTLPLGTALLYLVGGIAIIIVAGYLGSYATLPLTGWDRLARFYGSSRPFEGVAGAYPGSFLGVVPVSMGTELCVGASPEGLYLRIAHYDWAKISPLLIPWHDIRVRPARITLWPTYELSFRQTPLIKLYVPYSAAPLLRGHLAL
jgi:hypothetical protein